MLRLLISPLKVRVLKWRFELLDAAYIISSQNLANWTSEAESAKVWSSKPLCNLIGTYHPLTSTFSGATVPNPRVSGNPLCCKWTPILDINQLHTNWVHSVSIWAELAGPSQMQICLCFLWFPRFKGTRGWVYQTTICSSPNSWCMNPFCQGWASHSFNPWLNLANRQKRKKPKLNRNLLTAENHIHIFLCIILKC